MSNREQLEVDKMSAEIEKLRAEVKSISVQAEEQTRHWFLKPSSLIPILAGIAAIGSAFTQYQMRSLDDRKQALELQEQTIEFQRKKLTLEATINEMQAHKDATAKELAKIKNDLESTTEALKIADSQRTGLAGTIDALNTDLAARQKTLSEITEKIEQNQRNLSDLQQQARALPNSDSVLQKAQAIATSNSQLAESVKKASAEANAPLSALRQYYALVNSRNSGGAYDLFSSRYQKALSRAGYTKVFNDTKRIEMISSDVTQPDDQTAYVNALIEVLNGDGRSEKWGGTIRLRFEQGQWRIDENSLKRK